MTSGGHNVGIVSEPDHQGHSFQVMAKKANSHYIDPDAFVAAAAHKVGSWWPEWVGWLKERSGVPTQPPQMGGNVAPYTPICDAPGTYVFQQ